VADSPAAPRLGLAVTDAAGELIASDIDCPVLAAHSEY
jgi:hypothetical protein